MGLKFLTKKDLIEIYPFGANKIHAMIKTGVFRPMRDPITGERTKSGQRLIFLADQCEQAIRDLFEDKNENEDIDK